MSSIVKTEEHNGYTYDVYDNGTITAKGEIQTNTAPRNGYVQRKAGGDSRLPDDHGGHLVPSSQNGTPGSINITAQNGKVNTRDVRAVERDESAVVKNGANIQTERTSYCSNDPNRPDAYMYNDHVTMPDGTTHDIHHSWTNVDMSQYNDDIGLEEAPDSYDAAKNSGYTKEEYNSILENAENIDISDYEDGWISGAPNEASDMSDFGVNNDDTALSMGDTVSSSDDDGDGNGGSNGNEM